MTTPTAAFVGATGGTGTTRLCLEVAALLASVVPVASLRSLAVEPLGRGRLRRRRFRQFARRPKLFGRLLDGEPGIAARLHLAAEPCDPLSEPLALAGRLRHPLAGGPEVCGSCLDCGQSLSPPRVRPPAAHAVRVSARWPPLPPVGSEPRPR